MFGRIRKGEAEKDLELGALQLRFLAWTHEGHLERGFSSKQLPAMDVFMVSTKRSKEVVVSHVCFAAAVRHTFLWRQYISEA